MSHYLAQLKLAVGPRRRRRSLRNKSKSSTNYLHKGGITSYLLTAQLPWERSIAVAPRRHGLLVAHKDSCILLRSLLWEREINWGGGRERESSERDLYSVWGGSDEVG